MNESALDCIKLLSTSKIHAPPNCTESVNGLLHAASAANTDLITSIVRADVLFPSDFQTHMHDYLELKPAGMHPGQSPSRVKSAESSPEAKSVAYN